MELDIRPAAHDELPAFARAVDTAFGIHVTDEMVAVMRSMLLDRSLAVVDEGAIVAGAAALSLELALPGLTTIPAPPSPRSVCCPPTAAGGCSPP